MPLLVNGQAVSLDHLAPIRRRVTLQLAAGVTKAVDVEFRFSSHCYSRLPADGEEIPPDLFVRDGSDHHPRNRIYDQVRYDLSLKLVDCIDNIIATDAVVTRSKHNNFFHVSVAEATPAGVVTQVDYYVFMSARKVSEPNQPKMIKIFVETAYPNDPGGPAPGGGASRSFGTMLGEYWAPLKR